MSLQVLKAKYDFDQLTLEELLEIHENYYIFRKKNGIRVCERSAPNYRCKVRDYGLDVVSGDTPIKDIDQNDVMASIAVNLEDMKLSNYQKRNVGKELEKLLDVAIDIGALETNPLAGKGWYRMFPDNRKKGYTDKELEEMFLTVLNSRPWFKTLYSVTALYLHLVLGLDWHDMISVTWDDFIRADGRGIRDFSKVCDDEEIGLKKHPEKGVLPKLGVKMLKALKEAIDTRVKYFKKYRHPKIFVEYHFGATIDEDFVESFDDRICFAYYDEDRFKDFVKFCLKFLTNVDIDFTRLNRTSKKAAMAVRELPCKDYKVFKPRAMTVRERLIRYLLKK